MTREKFLSEIWRKFPSAERGAIDVARFLKLPGDDDSICNVGGRLREVNGAWVLDSAAGAFEFQFADECEWRSERAPFDVGVLRAGDLVCLEISAKLRSAVSCQLLVPTRSPFALDSRFDYERSRQWADFLFEVRSFFRGREFIEARTPTLVPSPGTEPFLDPFSTLWESGGERRRLFLPTSPEFHLKKLLSAGWTRVFELKTCFRNGEHGGHHQPEFSMLEWYRAYSDLESIAGDVADLIEWLSGKLDLPVRPRLVRTTMREVFARAFPGFELSSGTTRDELRALAARAQVRLADSDTWDEIFFRIFLEKIEGSIADLMVTDGPVLIHGYPPSQAALARIGADGFADRFEVYWRGFELANAFHELNDSVENEARFAEDAAKKHDLGKPAVPLDEGFLAALRFGLPPSGGIALGLDRLFMALFEIDQIAATRAFPFTR